MLETSKYKTVCDVGVCKNIAPYVINMKGFSRGGKFSICQECLAVLYHEIGKTLTPKSPKNIIARALKKAEEAVCE